MTDDPIYEGQDSEALSSSYDRRVARSQQKTADWYKFIRKLSKEAAASLTAEDKLLIIKKAFAEINDYEELAYPELNKLVKKLTRVI